MDWSSWVLNSQCAGPKLVWCRTNEIVLLPLTVPVVVIDGEMTPRGEIAKRALPTAVPLSACQSASPSRSPVRSPVVRKSVTASKGGAVERRPKPYASWTCPHCKVAQQSVMPHVAEAWAVAGCTRGSCKKTVEMQKQ